MELKESKQILYDKGYSINLISGNGKLVGMSKYIEDKNLWIQAEIREGSNTVELSCIVQGLFTIKTSMFSITHPRFEELFEDKLINLAYRATYSTL